MRALRSVIAMIIRRWKGMLDRFGARARRPVEAAPTTGDVELRGGNSIEQERYISRSEATEQVAATTKRTRA